MRVLLTGKQILVVEDDRHVSELIKATLELHNVNVTICSDGYQGLQAAQAKTYDVLILDIMLPQKDGLEICRQLRLEGYAYPIIMLTARADEIDRVLGLELGADDYVTKPFSPKELVARCKAVIRRFDRAEFECLEVIRFDDLEVRKGQYKVVILGSDVEFTPKEFELLTFLAEHPNHTFTRDQLLEHVWGFDTESETRTVDEHVKRLRRKLDVRRAKLPRIRTVWGVGYQFEVNHNA